MSFLGGARQTDSQSPSWCVPVVGCAPDHRLHPSCKLSGEVTGRFLRRAGLLLLGFLAMSGGALARPPSLESPVSPTEPATQGMDVTVGILAVGEMYREEAIVHFYQSSRFFGSGTAGVGITPYLSVEAEVGYVRFGAVRNDQVIGHFEMVPISLDACLRRELGRAEVFAGPGVAITSWNEDTDDMDEPKAGTKVGLDLRAGTRIHTNLVRPSLRPGPGSGLSGVDVELLVAHRAHHLFMGKDTGGLDLSAWQVGAGLVARL